MLSPDEFEEWHRCIAVPGSSGRNAASLWRFAATRGFGGSFSEDTAESDVIAAFERCFEGLADRPALEVFSLIPPVGLAVQLFYVGVVVQLPTI